MEQKVLEACEIMQDRDEREENKETKKNAGKKTPRRNTKRQGK